VYLTRASETYTHRKPVQKFHQLLMSVSDKAIQLLHNRLLNTHTHLSHLLADSVKYDIDCIKVGVHTDLVLSKIGQLD
jgi:hypothetical protein